MSDARLTFPSAVAVLRALARGEEGLPGNSRGVVDPRFFGLGIATGRLSLLADGAASLVQTRIDLAQLVLALALDAQMVARRPCAARRDREVRAHGIQHPFRRVSLHHGRLRREQRRIQLDRIREVFDADMNVYALHACTPYTAGSGWYPMRSIMASKYSRTLCGKRSPLTTAADRSNGRTRISSRDSLPLIANGLSINRSSFSSSGVNASMCSRVLARSSTKSPSCLRLRTT